MGNNYKVNEEIKQSKVLLISDSGKEEVTLEEALRTADEMELDLVQMSLVGEKAVCKLVDYSKMVYEQSKSSKKKAKGHETKEIKIGYNIMEHDVDIKIKQAYKLLAKGDRVKFVTKYKGREIKTLEHGKVIMAKIVLDLASIGHVVSPLKLDGGSLTVTLDKIGK